MDVTLTPRDVGSAARRWWLQEISIRQLLVGSALAASAFIVIWGIAPSEWSFIDGPGLKTALIASTSQYGSLGGIAHRIVDVAQADWNWGLFRPGYWLYCGVFYLASPAAAHAIRAGLFSLVVLGPLIYICDRRRKPTLHFGFLVFGLLLLLSNNSLYDGLAYSSLQELTGLAFVSGGLLTRRAALRTLLWVVAAWFKAPFSWLVLAWAVFLLIRGRRVLGVSALVPAVGTLAAAYIFARHGSYTSSFGISGHQLGTALAGFAHKAAAPVVVAALGMLALRVRPRRLVPRTGTTLVLWAGGVGYLANLMPWGRAGAYLASPVLWLLSTAVLISLASSLPTHISVEQNLKRRLLSSLAAAALVVAGSFVVFHASRLEYARLASYAGLRNWALTLPSSGVRIGVNDPESALRLAQIVRLHRPGWKDEVTYASPSAGGLQFYVDVVDAGVVAPSGAVTVRVFPRATVYRM